MILRLLKFIFSLTFLKHASIALVLVFVAGFLSLQSMKIYSNHGESITVPDLRGLSLEQLEVLLQEKQLRYQIIDSGYQVGFEPMAVIDQNPRPEALVKENRTIYLTVNASVAPTKPLPELLGTSHKNALIQLENRGFKIGELEYKPHPHNNTILEVKVDGEEVAAGQRFPKGTTIDLVLGSGLNNKDVEVPYVIGLDLQEAEFIIKSYALNIGAVIYADESEEAKAKAVVVEQFPAANDEATMRMGESVDIFMGDAADIAPQNP